MPKNALVRRIDQKVHTSGGLVVSGTTGGGGGVTDHGFLSGLADDDHTQYYNVTRGDARYVRQTVQVIAGAGMTGGGALSTDRTLTVGAGSGITVNADDVALLLNSTGALEVSTGARVKLPTNSGLTRDSTGLYLAPSTLTYATSNAVSGAGHTHGVTSSADVGTTPAESLLKSTSSGGLTLASLITKGSIDVTTGGDLTVGANIFFVDASQGNVGIQRAPDPQFDLDVAGALRAQYLVGKQALEIEGVLLLCQYDGWAPFHSNFYGQPDGHRGQTGTLTTAHNFRNGKFGKSLAFSPAMTNLVLNPSFTASTSGWTFAEPGSGGSLGRGSTFAQDDWLNGDGVGEWTGILVASTVAGASATAANLVSLANGATVTLSAMVRSGATVEGTLVIRDSTNGVDRVAGSITSLPSTGWQRTSCSWTNNTGGAVNISARIYNASTTVSLLFTNVQLEQTSYVTPYNDGDMPAGAWSGTQYASTSTRVAVNASYSTSGTINQGVGTIMAWVRGSITGAAQYFARVAGTSAGEINLYINTSGFLYGSWGTATVSSSTIVADNTWHYVAMTYSGSGSTIILYVDGVQVGTGTSSGFSGLPATMAVGTGLAGRIDMLCIVNRALPAKEILAIYHSDAPVFAVSSVFSFRISEAGLVWGDAEGLWVKDRNGNAVFGVYGALAGGKSWGGLTLDTGDLLMGTSAQYVKWDSSAGTLTVKGAIEVVGTIPNTSISGLGTLSTVNNSLDNINNGTTYARVNSTLISGGNIRVGSGTKDSTLNGFHIDSGEIVGQLAGVDQTVFNTSGQIIAGGGNVMLDVNGIALKGTLTGYDQTASYKFVDLTNPSVINARLTCYSSGGTALLLLRSEDADVQIEMTGSGAGRYMTFDADQVRLATGGVFAVPYGSATAPTYSFNGDDNTGFYNVTANTIGVTTSGTKTVEFATGYVAIGSLSDSIARIKPTGTNTVANNGTMTIHAAVRCVIYVFASDGGIGIFGCNGATNTYEISDPAAQFSNTATTASMTNIYVTGGNITLENKEGGSRTYEIFIFGGTAL